MTVTGLTMQVQKGLMGGRECTCVHTRTCVHAAAPGVTDRPHRGARRVTARVPSLSRLTAEAGRSQSCCRSQCSPGPPPCLAGVSVHLGLRIRLRRHQVGTPHGRGPCLLPAVPCTRFAPSEVLEMVTDGQAVVQTGPPHSYSLFPALRRWWHLAGVSGGSFIRP